MKHLLLGLLFLTANAYAFDRLSFATSAGTREQQVALDVSRFWQVGSSRLWLGAGVRGTSQSGADQGFQTAPALLTSGQEGPQVLFQTNKKENIDDLRFRRYQVTSLNAVFQILYELSEQWSVGTNIDVVGGSFGARQKGSYHPKKDASSYPGQVNARPTPLNLLLISDNDRGSLNSEFYARRNLGGGWGLKLAANFAFTEYTADQRLRKGNDRFRHKSLLPSLGITRDF